MTRGEVLARAEFDPKLRLYLVLQGAAVLAATIAGIAALPIWLVAGPIWARRYYDRLECVLTERALAYKKGILFRSEVTVPLDKIQDLTVKYGPVLDWFGAGQTLGGHRGSPVRAQRRRGPGGRGGRAGLPEPGAGPAGRRRRTPGRLRDHPGPRASARRPCRFGPGASGRLRSYIHGTSKMNQSRRPT